MFKKQYTILIVDSGSELFDALSGKLTQNGYKLLTANNGFNSARIAGKYIPDIIILELPATKMLCFETLKELKTDTSTANIPVIVISSIDDVDSKVDALNSGANDFIIKPFHFNEVLARIETQLRISDMRLELEKKARLLEQMAITDPLTELYNRRYLLNRLHSEINHTFRYNESISCLMIDVDHFKNINDNFGHQAGDIILKEIALILKKTMREYDVPIRYGGEEFIIICPNTDKDGAISLADRIRVNIETASFHIKDFGNVKLTISIGVSSMSKKDQKGSVKKLATLLISSADNALYNAKARGRNRIETA